MKRASEAEKEETTVHKKTKKNDQLRFFWVSPSINVQSWHINIQPVKPDHMKVYTVPLYMQLDNMKIRVQNRWQATWVIA